MYLLIVVCDLLYIHLFLEIIWFSLECLLLKRESLTFKTSTLYLSSNSEIFCCLDFSPRGLSSGVITPLGLFWAILFRQSLANLSLFCVGNYKLTKSLFLPSHVQDFPFSWSLLTSYEWITIALRTYSRSISSSYSCWRRGEGVVP